MSELWTDYEIEFGEAGSRQRKNGEGYREDFAATQLGEHQSETYQAGWGPRHS